MTKEPMQRRSNFLFFSVVCCFVLSCTRSEFCGWGETGGNMETEVDDLNNYSTKTMGGKRVCRQQVGVTNSDGNESVCVSLIFLFFCDVMYKQTESRFPDSLILYV